MVSNDLSNLSLIVQGPFNDYICNVLRYYKNQFPSLEIVIISWVEDYSKYIKNLPKKSENIKVITAPDPGGQISTNGEKFNVNRQLVSTKLGLENINREYCLKTRSDIELDLYKSTRQYNKFNRPNITNTQNKESILIVNLTTENPKYSCRYFSFCDWIYFGLTEDINNLIISEPYPDEFLSFKSENNSALRYNAEQWMVLKGLLGNDFHNIMPSSYSISQTVINNYLVVLKSMIILNPSCLGLKSYKYNLFQFALSRMFTFKEWKKLYFKDYNYKLDIERILYNMHGFLFKIKKFFDGLFLFKVH